MASELYVDFGVVRTDEIVTLGFDFDNVLAITSDTISTVANWTATVKSGTDATPSSLISGSASQSGTISRQKIDGSGGVETVEYWLTGSVTTTNGQTLVGTGTITIDDAET